MADERVKGLSAAADEVWPLVQEMERAGNGRDWRRDGDGDTVYKENVSSLLSLSGTFASVSRQNLSAFSVTRACLKMWLCRTHCVDTPQVAAQTHKPILSTLAAEQTRESKHDFSLTVCRTRGWKYVTVCLCINVILVDCSSSSVNSRFSLAALHSPFMLSADIP